MTSSHPLPSPVKAVIFDCDGTLVDSETSGMTALHEQACKLGYTLSLTQALDAFRGRHMALCVEMIDCCLRPFASLRAACGTRFRRGGGNAGSEPVLPLLPLEGGDEGRRWSNTSRR